MDIFEKIDNLIQKGSDKEYLKEGENSPSGKPVYDGPKGGKYYYRGGKGTHMYANTASYSGPKDSISTTAIDKNAYALGDVHGDLKAAKRAFNMAGIVNDAGNWVAGQKTVIQVGDLTDRGNQGIDVIKYFQQLEKQSKEAGGKFVSLIGNHDALLVSVAKIINSLPENINKEDYPAVTQYISGSQDYQGLSILETFRINGGKWNEAMEVAKDPKMMDWLIDRPMLMEHNGTLYVHADGDDAYLWLLKMANEFQYSEKIPKLKGYTGTELNIQLVNELTQRTMKIKRDGGYTIFCELVEARDITSAGADRLFEKFGGKRLVHGHTINPTNQVKFGGKVVAIDNGLSSGVQTLLGKNNSNFYDYAKVYKIRPPEKDFTSYAPAQAGIKWRDDDEIDWNKKWGKEDKQKAKETDGNVDEWWKKSNLL